MRVKLAALIGVARLNFLTLTLACVALAQCYSIYLGHPFQLDLFAVILSLGLLAHVSVNAFNEYFDFQSGLDLITEKTPFSGGSGSLVRTPVIARWALAIAIVSLCLVVLLGLALITEFGAQLFWIGVPGVVLIYSYTQYLNRSAVLCFLAPGVGFGLLMTLGAFWVFASASTGELSQSIPLGAWLLSLMVCLLVSNLLLINQLPDVEADRQVGRKHLPIVIGRKSSLKLASVSYGLALSMLPIGVVLEQFPALILLLLVNALLLCRILPALYRLSSAWQTKTAVPMLALNVVFVHLMIIGAGLLVWVG